MQHAALLTALLSVLALPAGDEVHLTDAPAAGSVRRIACELSEELSGGELEVEMGGSPVPAEYLPAIDFSMEDARALVVVDTFEADGWVRAYEEAAWSNAGALEIDSSGAVESYPWSADGRTPLLGRKVRFVRAEDGAEAPARAAGFADERPGDAALLDGLQVDLGLGELLPARAVAVGDTWSVDGAELAVLFEPAGDLAWELPPEAAAYLLADVRSRTCSGELELALESIEAGVAHCSVKGALARTTVQAGDLSHVPVADGTATETVTETWAVEGSLEWSVAEHRLVRLALSGGIHQDARTVRDADQPGPTYSSVMRFDGDRTLSIASEANDAADAADTIGARAASDAR